MGQDASFLHLAFYTKGTFSSSQAQMLEHVDGNARVNHQELQAAVAATHSYFIYLDYSYLHI